MDYVDVMTWSLATIGFLTVGSAVAFVLFLAFEDFWRKLFNRPKRVIVPVVKDNNTQR